MPLPARPNSSFPELSFREVIDGPKRSCLKAVTRIWPGFGVGPASFPMVAQSALLGGNIRVGLEDTFYLSRGNPAKSKVQLVEKAVNMLRSLDREPASPQEAREILTLGSASESIKNFSKNSE